MRAMSLSIAAIRELEARAARTWPAEVNVPLNGWLLRASGGVTKRANSVMTAGDGPGGSGWLEDIEAFYTDRALTPTFQVTEASPPDLDDLLARHGYAKETPCVLMTAQADAAAAAARQEWDNRHAEMELRVTERADAQWLDDFIRLEQFPAERLPFYEGLCARMPAGTLFYSLHSEGAAIAVATVIGEDGWGGIVNVAVDARLRGQGVGKRLMADIAEHSLMQQIDRLYLQVTANNEPALRLYRRFGFAPVYEYHYRVKVTP
jgi:ribosomal protein S18 acetylase RimI-like enzyme